MKKKAPETGARMPVPPLPKRSFLDKKAEKYLREGGKIEDMPEGKLKDADPQQSLKNLKRAEKENKDS